MAAPSPSSSASPSPSASSFAVCSTGEVAAGSARRFDVVDGAGRRHRICIVHIGDDWHAIGDECSHADYSLSEGAVWEDECEIECPKHGSTFSLLSGEPQTLPATTAVPVYRVRLDGDTVVVDLDTEEAAP